MLHRLAELIYEDQIRKFVFVQQNSPDHRR